MMRDVGGQDSGLVAASITIVHVRQLPCEYDVLLGLDSWGLSGRSGNSGEPRYPIEANVNKLYFACIRNIPAESMPLSVYYFRNYAPRIEVGYSVKSPIKNNTRRRH